MKKDLWELSIQGIKGRKRSSILLLAVLILSFSVAVISLSVTESMNKTNEEYRFDTHGTWYGAVIYGEEEDETFLKGSEWIDQCGITRNYGVFYSGGSMVGIGTIDDTFRDIGRIRLQDGSFPGSADEIAMEASVLSGLGYDYELGQEITLNIGFCAEGEIVYAQKTYILCGVLKAYTQLWGTVSVKDGSVLLSSAVVTEEAGEELLLLADEVIDGYNEALIREAEENDTTETVSLLTADRIVPQYYFTVKEGMEEEMERQVNTYLEKTRDVSVLEARAETNPALNQNQPLSVKINRIVYDVGGDVSYAYVYVILTYAAALLAVLCIYTIQMQKQVKQIALFRSIGITKRQLRWISFFETLSLCLPSGAVGMVCGGIGVYFLLRFLVYTGSVNIQVSIPFAAIFLLILFWTLGIFAMRILVLQIALRQPLTGRMMMSWSRARRVQKWRKAEITILSALFCGTVFFTGMESLGNVIWFQSLNHEADYVMYTKNVSTYEDLEETSVLLKERLEAYRQITGVDWVNGYSQMSVYLDNGEIRNSTYFKTYVKANAALGATNPDVTFLYSVPEEEWGHFFGKTRKDPDMEAFREGEMVFVSFDTNSSGELYLRTFEEEKAEDFLYFDYDDIGLKEGDEIRFTVRGMEIEDSMLKEEKETGMISVKVGDILPDGVPGIESGSYTILCSEQFLENVLALLEDDALQGTEYIYSDHYRTGEELGYTKLSASAGMEAGYLSTDYVLAALCNEDGLEVSNHREENASWMQEALQTLLLLFSSGICIALVLLLIIGNALTLETYIQQRKYGILQAIGMSERQIRKDIRKKAFLAGITALLSGWGIYGIYFVWKAVHNFYGPRYEGMETFTFVRFFSGESGGLSAGIFTALGVTVGALVVLILVWRFTKKPLFRANIMDKICMWN